MATPSMLPWQVKIAIGAVELPGAFHADPADRFIVATARKLEAPLKQFSQNSELRISWFWPMV